MNSKMIFILNFLKDLLKKLSSNNMKVYVLPESSAAHLSVSAYSNSRSGDSE
jgi:hypothetical protein